MDPATIVAAIIAGALIGFVLGLVGGGGSILAVPLLVYLVGVESTHAAIGTAAVAVALSAALNLAGHARADNVKWGCALVFALSGMAGAAIGAELGKATDGQSLLAAFGGLMVVVGATMFRPRRAADQPEVKLTRQSAKILLPRLVPAGLGVGLMAGFFGIGGGFLIVPALMFATAMPIGIAIGSSLVAVTALGATTAGSYALSGYVDWWLVAMLALGGLVGGVAGRGVGKLLEGSRKLLERGFATLVIGVGVFVVYGTLS